VPISAHALFARPLVVSPRSVVALEVLPERRVDERVEASTEPGASHGGPDGADDSASVQASATTVTPSIASTAAATSADPPRAVLWCDGRRKVSLPPGARVEVRRGSESVRLARLHQTPFTNRLVTKFGLPVSGWRGRARPHVSEDR
jgi:NAD+ kinase